jgi:hypothetical protein
MGDLVREACEAAGLEVKETTLRHGEWLAKTPPKTGYETACAIRAYNPALLPYVAELLLAQVNDLPPNPDDPYSFWLCALGGLRTERASAIARIAAAMMSLGYWTDKATAKRFIKENASGH